MVVLADLFDVGDELEGGGEGLLGFCVGCAFILGLFPIVFLDDGVEETERRVYFHWLLCPRVVDFDLLCPLFLLPLFLIFLVLYIRHWLYPFIRLHLNSKQFPIDYNISLIRLLIIISSTFDGRCPTS